MSGAKVIALVLAIFIFLVLEVVCLDKIEIRGIKPDLLLIALIFFSLRKNLMFGLKLGLVLGFLKGVFTAGLLGINMFAFGLCGLIIGKYFKFIYREGILIQLAVAFLLSLFTNLVYYIVSLFFNILPNMVSPFKNVILPSGIYTVIFAFPVFLLLQKLFYETK